MAQPVIHHRTPQFSAIFAEAKAGLKELFQTEQDVLILASSGSGAMEGSVTNLFSPGDEVLTVNAGKFGERWTKIASAYGLTAHELKVEWGQAVRVEDVRAMLERHPGIRGILMQASETSTTALHPVEAIAAITRERDVMLVVDGITAVGVMEIPMDRWGIDVLLTGSQKALMLPPGLAFAALSERAWARNATASIPRFYFDFAKERASLANDTTAWTPAISLIIGLREALAMMREEGWSALYARQAHLGEATRAATTALGMRLLAPDNPSPAATGAFLPDGVPGGKLVGYLRDKLGVTLAGGQDQLKGKIVRIAHLGHIERFDTIIAIAALEMGLRHFGASVTLGTGVAAAEQVLLGGLPE
jgi:aspartate aminotransferase-like enzyme